MDIVFHELTLDDKQWIQEAENEDIMEICDQSFGTNITWGDYYNIKVADVCGCVVYLYESEHYRFISFPLGKNYKEAAQVVLDYVRDKEIYISPMSFIQRQRLLELGYDDLMIAPVDGYFDYVYSREKLATLSGKKLAGKRNHINRFCDGGQWGFEFISPENKNECLELENRWIADKVLIEPDEKEKLQSELKGISFALDNMDELGFEGDLIRQNGRVVAFAIWERLNEDTVVTHFEKADGQIRGAYQMINRETARHLEESIRYINREDDQGISGLKKAKESYYPAYMERKYELWISSVTFASENDISVLKKLWKDAFDDPEEYINEYYEHLMRENDKGQRWLDSRIFVIRKNGKVVSMASVFDGILKVEDGSVDVKYVYGVATDKEYRNKGYASEIISYIREYYEVPLVLKPADDGLRNYYKGLGFNEASYDDIELIDSGDLIDECDYKENLMIF